MRRPRPRPPLTAPNAAAGRAPAAARVHARRNLRRARAAPPDDGRIVIRPVLRPSGEGLDVTDAVLAEIESELSNRRRGRRDVQAIRFSDGRVTVRCGRAETTEHFDVTHAATAAIARRLSLLYPGSPELDWLEAQWHLGAITLELP